MKGIQAKDQTLLPLPGLLPPSEDLKNLQEKINTIFRASSKSQLDTLIDIITSLRDIIDGHLTSQGLYVETHK